MKFLKASPVFYAEALLPILQFYTEELGFTAETIYPDQNNPEVLILDRDNVTIIYSKTGPMPRSSGQVNIDVDDVYAVLDSLPVTTQPEWGPEEFFYGRTEFGIRDPNGIMVVFSMPNRKSE